MTFWSNLIDLIIDDEDYRTEVMRNSKVKYADNHSDAKTIFKLRIEADFWRRFHQDILFEEKTLDAKNRENARQKLEDDLKDARLNGQTDEVKRLEQELLPFIAKDDLAIEIRRQLSEIESEIIRILTANPNDPVANEQLAAAAKGAENNYQEKSIPSRSWRPKFTYARFLQDKRFPQTRRFERFNIQKILGRNPSLPAKLPFVQVTEKGLVFPENQRVVYRSKKLAKKLRDLGIRFLMGEVLTSTKFLDQLRNKEDGDLKQFMKEEGVYEITIPEIEDGKHENLIPYANRILERFHIELDTKYTVSADVLRRSILELLSHVEPEDIKKYTDSLELAVGRTALWLKDRERNRGDYLGYKLLIFFTEWNALIKKILLSKSNSSDVVLSLMDPDMVENSFFWGQETMSYFFERIDNFMERLEDPKRIKIFLEMAIVPMKHPEINSTPNDTIEVPQPYDEINSEDKINDGFAFIDEITNPNGFLGSLFNLLISKSVSFYNQSYVIQDVKLLAEENAESARQHPIFKVISYSLKGEEKVLLVKWMSLRKTIHEHIATQICQLLDVPSYRIQFFDSPGDVGEWELLEYHVSDLVATTFKDMMNPKGVFVTPGINAALVGDRDILMQRFRSFGQSLAVEYILNARDSGMKHILLRRSDGLFFRIDWEYLLDFESPENDKIPSVLRGDDRKFLSVLAGQRDGKEILRAIWEGFKMTYEQAQEKQEDMLKIISDYLPESNVIEGVAKRLAKTYENITQELGLVNSGFIETQVEEVHFSRPQNTKRNPQGGIDLEKTKDTVEFKGDGAALPPVMPPDPAVLREFETLPSTGVTYNIFYMGPVPDVSAFVGEIPQENQTNSTSDSQDQSVSILHKLRNCDC